MIDGTEHDGNSGRRQPVESSIFSFILYHVGSHVPTLSLNLRARSGHFHDVIHANDVNQVAVWEPIPYLIRRCNSSWADDRSESVGWILNRNSPAPGT